MSKRIINQTLMALEKALPIVRQASMDELWDHPLRGTVVSETRDRMEKLRIP